MGNPLDKEQPVVPERPEVMTSRYLALLGALCVAIYAGPSSASDLSSSPLRDYIASAAPQLPQCSAERQSIAHTVDALGKVSFPKAGKFVLVNIPAGLLTAYEDSNPVFEMKVIVGTEEHQTPVWTTHLTQVRLNPTWTVPYSIIKDDNWADRFKSDPEFFVRNRFEFRDAKNNLMTLDEAAADPSKVAKYIQAPGRYNALGEYRFNIRSSNSIYLHDTRDRQNFYDGSPIGLSHGCVRVENPSQLAQWLLDKTEDEINSLKRDGSTLDLPIEQTIPIVLGYFTAWPNSDGEIIVYDDLYSIEKQTCQVVD